MHTSLWRETHKHCMLPRYTLFILKSLGSELLLLPSNVVLEADFPIDVVFFFQNYCQFHQDIPSNKTVIQICTNGRPVLYGIEQWIFFLIVSYFSTYIEISQYWVLVYVNNCNRNYSWQQLSDSTCTLSVEYFPESTVTLILALG